MCVSTQRAQPRSKRFARKVCQASEYRACRLTVASSSLEVWIKPSFTMQALHYEKIEEVDIPPVRSMAMPLHVYFRHCMLRIYNAVILALAMELVTNETNC